MSLQSIIRCYICLKKLEFYRPSIRTQCTTYTETPIKTYLEQLSDIVPLTESDMELEEIVICEDCHIKLNDYDLACSTAKNIENDLRNLLKKSKEFIIKPEFDIKVEHDDISQQSIADEIEALESLDGNDEDEDEDDDDYVNDDVLSSDDEKPLIKIKKEKKIHVKREIKLKKDNSDDNVIKKRGRPKISNKKFTIRRVKSSIPDSEVPTLLKCPICALQMTAIVSYKRHLRTHLKGKGREFRCSKCGARYNNQSDLDVHVEKHKTIGIGNPLQCVECEKIFSSRTNLMRHIPIHTGETLYICELCGREYIHHSSFREHKAGHFNIKTKPCPICGRMFNTSSHLARHVRTHTGEKPFSCTICERKFANKYNMRSHMKIHSQGGDNEIATCFCVVCQEGFTKSNKLRDHMKRAHNQIAIGDDEAISSTYIPLKTTTTTVNNDQKTIIHISTTDITL